MSRIKIEIKAENIGIHSLLYKEIESASCKLGFYANNGSGKTFLSKAFALYEKAKSEKPSSREIDRLLSFGKDKGSFEFLVQGLEPASPAEKLKISINRGKGVTIDAASRYKFHVFNSDYIKKNLEEREYLPDSNIHGVILGTENIDVAHEEETLSKNEKERQVITTGLKSAITSAKAELSAIGIRSTTGAFAKINYDNLIADEIDESNVEKFDVLIERLKRLESMPEDLADVSNITVPTSNGLFDEISELISTEHTPANFTEAFKARMRERNEFIRHGLRFVEDNTCPFCEQRFDETAGKLIQQYSEFLANEEAKVIESCKQLRSRLDSHNAAMNGAYKEWTKLRGGFEGIKSYLPSSNDLTLSGLQDTAILNESYKVLGQLLSAKEANIRAKFEKSDFEGHLSIIEQYQSEVRATAAANAKPIQDVNKRKNDVRGQKLAIKKDLCISRLFQLREESAKKVSRLKSLDAEIQVLAEDIREKKNRNKRDKKQEVARALVHLLKLFFGEKYSFDEEKFCLTFSDSRLAANADDVLSDGEKGIVAFCHYLATTHCLVESDGDYNDLFFVIDDPISSMDFHFVYKVADCIRRLQTIFTHINEKRIRYILFTHNLEFISILGRNNICTHTFALRNGVIDKTDCSSALPYEPHLKDIIRVSNGSEGPNHTTSNSIRHTLETIGKFTRPGTKFETFFEEIEELKADPYLWNLMNDQSHGAVRDQPSFVAEDIKRSCRLVVDYVERQFPHQVTAIKTALSN